MLDCLDDCLDDWRDLRFRNGGAREPQKRAVWTSIPQIKRLPVSQRPALTA